MLGPVLIVLGLMWPGWIRMPLPAIPMHLKRAGGLWGAFALGIPFAVAVGWLESLKVLSRSQKTFEIVGGLVLILAGLYLLNAYFIVIPGLAI